MKLDFFKNPKIFYLALIAVLFSLIAYKFFRDLTFFDNAWNLEKDERQVVNPQSELLQKFIASRDGLTEIRILFRQSYSKDSGQIKLELDKEDCQIPIAKSEFRRSQISDGYYDLHFPKVDDSEGKVFCLKVGFTPEKDFYKDLYVFTKPGTPDGAILIESFSGKVITGRSLAMQPAYKNASILGDLSELDQRISQYKPWYLKHFYLYFIEVSFILLSFAIIISLILVI